MSFKNKVVIVTGASSGIGAAAAVAFAEQGANVVLVGRNEARLQDVADQCASVGSEPFIIKADVANDEDVKRIINDTLQKFGKLDVLVNNAGVLESGTILDGTVLDSFDKTVNINFRAAVHTTMLAAPHLIQTKGNIVNVSSVFGQFHLTPLANAYSSLKAGLDHFTRGSAKELASSGVRVNAVSPGPVETNMLDTFGSRTGMVEVKTALGRIAQPQEAADLILYVANEKAKGITGSVFVLDSGLRLA